MKMLWQKAYKISFKKNRIYIMAIQIRFPFVIILSTPNINNVMLREFLREKVY